jgi:hypothetical protein
MSTPNGASGPSSAPPPNPAMQAYQQAMAQYRQQVEQYQQAVAARNQVIASNQQKQQQFDAAIALIKRDGIHGFRIDIEADSTIAPDEQAEKASRTDFIQKFVPFLEQVVPFAQGNKAGAAFAKSITLWVVRAYRVARPLEEDIENFFDALAQAPPPQGKDGPDSPADLALRGKQLQLDQGKVQAQLQIAREKNAVEMAKLGQEAHATAAELAAKETHTRMEHGLNVAKMADESVFRHERAANLEAREARNLT